MSRVVVVGGGLGGCAAAVRLAKVGHEVTLLERRDRVGGAVGFVEQEGFRWDAGPSATALPAVLRDLFRKSGRPLEREADLVPVAPLREHRFPDGTILPLPSGSRAAQLHAVDDALGAGAGRAWVDHVHSLAPAWDLLRRDWFERPYVAGVTAEETTAVLRSRRSLDRSVRRRFADPRLRSLATHHAVQGGHDPRRVPAWMGLVDYLEQNFGTWTFRGGFGNLAELLARRLAQRRVTVLTGTAVEDLELSSDTRPAVRTRDAADRLGSGRTGSGRIGSGRIEADHVVVAVDPRCLPALARHVRRSSPAAPPAVTHLGLSPGVPHLSAEVIFHGEPTLTVRTGGTAPGGGAAWTVLTRGPLRGDPLEVLAGRGLDVRDAVVVRVDRSPADIVREHGGSPFGTLWRGRATVDGRLATTIRPGVHLVGAHTGGGAWVPFVGLTAAVAADAIGSGEPHSRRRPPAVSEPPPG